MFCHLWPILLQPLCIGLLQDTHTAMKLKDATIWVISDEIPESGIKGVVYLHRLRMRLQELLRWFHMLSLEFGLVSYNYLRHVQKIRRF